MASLIREGSLRVSPLVSKPPSKILIIPAVEVVQVVAKVFTLLLWMGLSLCSYVNVLERLVGVLILLFLCRWFWC